MCPQHLQRGERPPPAGSAQAHPAPSCPPGARHPFSQPPSWGSPRAVFLVSRGCSSCGEAGFPPWMEPSLEQTQPGPEPQQRPGQGHQRVRSGFCVPGREVGGDSGVRPHGSDGALPHVMTLVPVRDPTLAKHSFGPQPEPAGEVGGGRKGEAAARSQSRRPSLPFPPCGVSTWGLECAPDKASG